MSEWQDISTAQREPGRLLLLWDADVGHPEVASWSQNHGCWVIGYSGCDPALDLSIIGDTVYAPTHWQPLPPPPTGE